MCISYYLLGKKQGGGSSTLIEKNITANNTYNASDDSADGYSKVVVNVQPNLETKSVTITENTTTTITPTSGKDGMSSVSVTTNVPTGADGEKLKQLIERDNSKYITFEIPSGVTKIGDGSFSKWEKLQTIVIPNTVTSIGKNSFQNCTNLYNITIPNSVTSIGEYAFNNCNGLNNIVIPNSVTNIDSYAFGSCQNLLSITLPNAITTIKSSTFSGSGLKTITIPNSVTTIEYGAFGYCSYMTEVTMSSNITSIGNSSFSNCSRLVKVDCSNCIQIPSVNNNSFNSTSANLKIIVPDALYNDWITTSGWTNYASKIVKASEYTE